MIFFHHMAIMTSKPPLQTYNTLVCTHYVHKGITIIQKLYDIHECIWKEISLDFLFYSDFQQVQSVHAAYLIPQMLQGMQEIANQGQQECWTKTTFDIPTEVRKSRTLR